MAIGTGSYGHHAASTTQRANNHPTTRSASTLASAAIRRANPALQTDGQFGTPTIAVDGRKVDVSDPDWLKDAVAG